MIRAWLHSLRCDPPLSTLYHEPDEIFLCPTGEHAWRLEWSSQGGSGAKWQWVRVR